MKRAEAPKFEWLGKTCPICGTEMNTWDKRCCIATATPVFICESCLAEKYGKDKEGFRELMEEYFDIRPCQGVK